MCFMLEFNKKLSYRRETARQLPTWRGAIGPPAHFPSAPSGYTYAQDRIRNRQQTYMYMLYWNVDCSSLG